MIEFEHQEQNNSTCAGRRIGRVTLLRSGGEQKYWLISDFDSMQVKISRVTWR